MIPANIFRENGLIEVYDDTKEIYYKSIIQEVNRDNIAIGIPMGNRGQLYLYKGDICTFRILHKDAHYYFKSKILGRKRSGRILLYLIDWPEEVKRIQKRAYFRFPCSIEIFYWILPTSETANKQESKQSPFEKIIEPLGPPQKAIMADISGGGLQMVTNQKIPRGNVLALRIPMQSKNEKKTFELQGKIVWASTQDKAAKIYRQAAEFINIREAQREEIIRFIFVLSRERIRS
ncbi:MAG TPA: hypothetical protein GXZ24_08730 [Firmicutes bacterium]|jgi:c-di-GMP-binding flagellar brake protein YcgR|nr:hypothetical protein [Bacillota bacterium]